MKKLIILIIMLFMMIGCSSKTDSNNIDSLLNDGYTIESSTFSETYWRGLFSKDDSYLIVETEFDEDLYNKAHENFFEDDKYQEIIKELEISKITDISDKIPSIDDLQKYVGKTFGEIEDDGFENTGYCECDNYQFSFCYENEIVCVMVKNSTDTPIKNIDDLTEEDIRNLVVCEVIDRYVSSNVICSE